MNISSCELTEAKSAYTRMWLRFWWSLAGLVIFVPVFYFWSPNFASSAPTVLTFSVALVLYMPTLGFALDRWRLRHPSAPAWKVWFLATVGALMVFQIMILCIVLVG